MTTSDYTPSSASVPQPTYHTSLLTAIDSRDHIHLILGTNSLAATRAAQSLAAGAKPILIAPPPPADTPLHHALQSHIEAGALTWLARPFSDDDILTLGRPEIGHFVDAVFVTPPASKGDADLEASRHVSALCRRHRVPVNVVDAPALCTFTLLSTHVDGPLQVGVTTNGRGCKLASRIRREVAASLPAGLGAACARLGDVRRRIQEEDRLARHHHRHRHRHEDGSISERPDGEEVLVEDEGSDDSLDQTSSFNRLVTDADREAAKTRRMRWLGQVCEYWPLRRLASITDGDVDAILQSYHDNITGGASADPPQQQPNPDSLKPRRGRIILAGSGPGHPDLLMRATHKAILAADVVLADKLVPAGVLDLIPRRTPVHIARKFPGNADRAQEELLSQAIAGVEEGKTVLRLKQGDPFVYGRGGEEVEFFASRGMGDRVVVLPGVTSALSAPLFAGVPVTQRDVADQVLVCTGTGKKGVPPAPPAWVASRTVVFLMALHRIGGLVGELTRRLPAEADDEDVKREDGERRRLWPLDTPCAVIERASCPDQRVIRTTLRYVEEAIEQEGSRPPGLLVVGRACEALYTPEKGRSWVVEDGFKGLDLEEFSLPEIAVVE